MFGKIIGPKSECQYVRKKYYSRISGISGLIVILGNLELMRTNLIIEGYGGKITKIQGCDNIIKWAQK